MVAEMQNQDPLEPTDNSDYMAQLATFTQVEATKEMNDKFAAFVDIFTMLGASTTVCIFGVPRRIYGDAARFQDPVGLCRNESQF